MRSKIKTIDSIISKKVRNKDREAHQKETHLIEWFFIYVIIIKVHANGIKSAIFVSLLITNDLLNIHFFNLILIS